MGVSAVEWRLASTAEEYTPFPISYGEMWVHEFFGYTAAIQNGGVVVGSSTPGVFVYGAGANTKLYVVKEDEECPLYAHSYCI